MTNDYGNENHFSRRQFLSVAAVGSAAMAGGSAFAPSVAHGVDPIKRAGDASMRLSLAAYSFRDFFNDPAKMDMVKFIDYCADQGLEGTELTSYYFPNDAAGAYFVGLKRHAFLRGIAISGTAVGNNFALPKSAELDKQIADVKRWVDRAAILGAPHIRVFAGAPKKEMDTALAVKNCIESLEECCDYAGTKGIFLGLENHGGIVAEVDGMLEIINGVKSEWLGVNLDTGNFHTDDPYGDLAKIAPWAVNVQVKVEMKARGAAKAPADLKRLVAILRDANYQGFVVLEHEAKENPWTTIPGYLDQLQTLIQ